MRGEAEVKLKQLLGAPDSQSKCEFSLKNRRESICSETVFDQEKEFLMNSYTHLSLEERYLMCQYLVNGFSIPNIALLLSRSPSTLYRELKRNKRHHNGAYAASVAHSYYRGRLRRSRKGSQYEDEIWSFIFFLLSKKWSPEQIVFYLKENSKIIISIQTIYRKIKKDRRKGGLLYHNLRIMPKVRRKAYGTSDSRGRLGGKKNISERPEEANMRLTVGHWEADTVMGANKNECVLTMVDRKSGFAFIEKMRNRTAKEALYALNRIIKKEPNKFKTITFDNGTEFHSYKSIERTFKIPCYFANSHRPWERGCNENFNGLLRQYIPKGSSLKNIGSRRIETILQELNERPRKRHGFKSPKEVYLSE